MKLRHLGEAFELFLLVRIERKPVAAEADIQNAKADGAFRHQAAPHSTGAQWERWIGVPRR